MDFKGRAIVSRRQIGAFPIQQYHPPRYWSGEQGNRKIWAQVRYRRSLGHPAHQRKVRARNIRWRRRSAIVHCQNCHIQYRFLKGLDHSLILWPALRTQTRNHFQVGWRERRPSECFHLVCSVPDRCLLPRFLVQLAPPQSQYQSIPFDWLGTYSKFTVLGIVGNYPLCADKVLADMDLHRDSQSPCSAR